MAKDFRKKTFGKTIRGYAPEEVDEYLGYINEEYRKVEYRAADAERKLALALRRLDEQSRTAAVDDENSRKAQAESKQKAEEIYKKAEQEAEAVIAAAETTALNIREAAASEAEKKLTDAEAAARSIIESAAAEVKKAREQADAVYDAASEMYDEVRSFKDMLFSLYNTHIESVESIEESAGKYISRVDAVYSEASGENVSHDEDCDEADEENDVPEEEEESDSPRTSAPSADIYIDIPDDTDDDLYVDLDEELEDEPDFTDDVPEDKSADSGDDMAVTRVLRLSAISEAVAKIEDGDGFEEYDDSGYGDEADDEASGDDGEADDNDDFNDFDNEDSEFKDLDSLFTSEPSADYAQKDEFDIVFADSDSRRNVEEIRRQPIVPAEESKKPKKHKKF